MAGDFRGRVVVVTGGSGELGSAVVAELLARGAEVHVPVRGAGRPGPLDALAGPALRVALGVDVSDEAGAARFYEGLGGLWASIHCAGGFLAAPIDATSWGAWEGMMRGNAASVFLCCREAVRAMRRSGTAGPEGRGRIVNVAAMPALEPRRGAGMSAYAASKAAVAALTVALAEEVAAEGLWVNAIAPSILDTPSNRAAMPDADVSRWVAPADAAAVAAFLASPANLATRGAVMPVLGRG